MADPHAAVTDTHPLLFHAAARGSRLGRRARAHFEACEKREAIVYVPAVVVWEVSLLARRGRIDLGRPPRNFFQALFSNPAYQPFELTPEQVYRASDSRPNEDPFDGLIVAAANELGLPLITADASVCASGLVKVLR